MAQRSLRPGFLLLAATLPAEAEQAGGMARIGLLATYVSLHLHAFEAGLRELGDVEGQSVVIERHNVKRESSCLPALAAAWLSWARRPIVTRSSDEPVESGLVTRLARPGGNITGVYSLDAELGPKRVELIKETLPRITRVAVLRDPGFPGGRERWREVEQAARALGLTIRRRRTNDEP